MFFLHPHKQRGLLVRGHRWILEAPWYHVFRDASKSPVSVSTICRSSVLPVRQSSDPNVEPDLWCGAERIWTAELVTLKSARKQVAPERAQSAKEHLFTCWSVEECSFFHSIASQSP